VGIGSPHGDDQVGWRLVEGVSRAPGLAVEVYRASTPLDLLDYVGERSRVIVVDACRSGRPVGSVAVLRGEDVFLPALQAGSCHALGVAQALALAQALGRCQAELVLFAVDVGPAGPVGELSSELEAALPRLVRQLCDLVEAEPRPGDDAGGQMPRDEAQEARGRKSFLSDLVGCSRVNSEVGS
jgi:hydrogenase maturation protease